ncbi:bifunctional UDP-sugar hydrolase/5'-nucleotidase [Intestinimonas timonensis]|uniref:bifunctional metallophosphatase/5'-nucleotidase n=1 Tax=Intestinimonas timonensis TaxID=1689270 RepID=UPI0023F09593|nr:bifunctional UDP-sugar hydrolase/5'-nucleotidase [Intestinimonas timonensis]
MRYLRSVFALVLSAVLLLGSGAAWAAAPEEPGELTILFTHDTHDHFLPAANEEGGEYGGYIRLATLLKEQRQAAAEQSRAVVTLDGGDFSMGSLFQTIYTTDAPELRALGAMEYDVTTLGNHEFDYRQQGLADMLNAAKESGDPLPAIVQANYTQPMDHDSGYAVVQALENYPVTDYTVIERDGLRVAVFGVLGEDADDCAPMSGMELEPIADAAKRVVAEIKEKEDPDYIICLSHSGTDGTGRGEDYELAKAVDGIDVIISGHTHTTIETPIQVNGTLVVSCGEYTQNLGVLTVSKAEGKTELVDYQLLPVDETVTNDPAMTALARSFQRTVDETYLSGYGLTFDEVLCENPYNFTPISQFGAIQEEDALGNLIADSYVYAVKEAEGENYVPVDFAVVASGVIRASLAKGDITVSDAFDVSSLGSGADGTPGYPLVGVYITGKELKDAFEVDASVTPLMSAAQLYGSGMKWSFNTHRMIFDKVTDCAQILPDGTEVPIQDDKLYRVVTGLYSGQMLGTVNGKSFGLLTITPRDEKGQPIENLEDYIIHGPGGTEVKEWYALASYLQSMGTVDSRYAAPEGRKTVSRSWNPIELVRSPGWITLAAMALAVLVVAIIILLVTKPLRRRSRRGYRAYRGRRRR